MLGSKYPLVIIIILNWNGKKLLKTCLSSLFRLTAYPNYKVIVVDNGSTDSSVEFVKKHFPKADILALDKNYGFAEGNNKGIKYVLKKYSPKYILLLSNDIKIVQKDWLGKLVRTAESNKKIGSVCPIEISKKPLFKDKKIISSTPWFSCCLIKSKVFFKIGLLDLVFYPAYYEDNDFAIRFKKSGFLSVHRTDCSIIHYACQTSSKIDFDKIFFFRVKNKTIYLSRYSNLFKLIYSLSRSFLYIFINPKYLSPNKSFFRRFIYFFQGIKCGLIFHKYYCNKLDKDYEEIFRIMIKYCNSLLTT